MYLVRRPFSRAMKKPIARQILLLCLFLLAAHLRSVGQDCGTKEVNERLLREHPEYRSQQDAFKQDMQNRIQTQSGQRSGVTLYTIPVVVHVIHLGEAVGSGSNISTTQIQNAILGLNQRFSNAIGNSLEIGIQFCLATRDPNGNPTTGINRVNGSSVTNFSSQGIQWDDSGGASEVDVKLLSIWPRDKYYNIWVVHTIYGAVAGYAYFPTSYPLEGMVIEAAYMTQSSTVLTHEMGHAFDLYHTFEGDDDGATCPSNTNCSMEGDLICDTPPHKRGDCSASNPCSASGTFTNSRLNYMSYCGSTDRFTADQKTRMITAVNSALRTPLLSSLGCTASTCAASCNDANACTQDICTNGVCSHTALDCNDSDACTNDICTNFDCFNVEIDCADNDECTVDLCSGGCIHQPLDCSDGDACTTDSCNAGQCYNTEIACNDANSCTTDNCVPDVTSISIDYDLMDEDITQLAGGTYSRKFWQLNNKYVETNQAYSGKLEWAATRFNWLQDLATQQQYSYNENDVRVDSVDVTFLHRNVTGTKDTIIVVIYEDQGGIVIDNQDNILNSILYADTIVTTTSLSPNVSTPVTLRLNPDLPIPYGSQFMVGVYFFGSFSNTFSIVAGYGVRCGGACRAYSLFDEDNSYWKIIFWSGSTNLSGVNNLYFNCDGDGERTRASCEGYDIQNFAISAIVTLHSRVDYTCQNTPAACLVNISGAIKTETNVGIPGVSVVLSGDASDTVVTPATGFYSFQVAEGGDYTITPSKNNDVTTNNGVSTLDITLMRRHILGGTQLNSPYKIIAADGNNNNLVTTQDISSTRVVVLNNTAKFPNNRLWSFVSSEQTFTGPPYTPFPFTKIRTYSNLSGPKTNQNFIGVKLGDVNNSWNAGTP